MARSHSERVLAGRKGAAILHANVTDPSAHTAPARAAFEARFYAGLESLPDDTQHRIAAQRRNAYFADLALKSARARRLAREAVEAIPAYTAEADAAEAELSALGYMDGAA